MLFSRHARTANRRASAILALGALAMLPALPATAAPPEVAPAANSAQLTAPARAVLDAAPVVTASSEASWTFDSPTITVELPTTPTPAAPTEPVPPANPDQPAPATSPAPRTEPTPAPTPPPAPASAPPAAAIGSAVVEVAAQFVGVPYVSGGATPDGFDCSGFTSYVYAQLGITLPRSSGDQRYAGTVVPRDQAQPGDLIWSPGHVGIYAGDNTQIDSPRPGKSIDFRPIWQPDPVFIRIS